MSEEQKQWTYNMEDIFETIPDNPEEVLMNIPEEICEQIGLKPGDNIKISIGDQGTMIIEKLDKEPNDQE